MINQHIIMKQILIVALIFFAFLFTAFSQEAPPFWKYIVEFKHKDSAIPPPEHPILFTGSSSFTKWQAVSDSFPGYTIINRAFGGSTLLDVIRYAYDVIIPYQPRQVIIYCGENDLAASDNVSAEEVVTRFKTLYGIIRQNLPNAEIDFVSMKPSPSREKLQLKMITANKAIRAFMKKQKKAEFIDIYQAMLDKDGKMRDELYVEDRLHMQPAGYAIWTRYILPYLIK
jgi:lysophospholipase L1-like esterase